MKSTKEKVLEEPIAIKLMKNERKNFIEVDTITAEGENIKVLVRKQKNGGVLVEDLITAEFNYKQAEKLVREEFNKKMTENIQFSNNELLRMTEQRDKSYIEVVNLKSKLEQERQKVLDEGLKIIRKHYKDISDGKIDWIGGLNRIISELEKLREAKR